MKLKLTGGAFKGRFIDAPKGKTTRPTSEKLRKTIFDICQMQIEGSITLDLFSGSGALGLESISRGASKSFLIDSDFDAQMTILNNIKLLKVESSVTLLRTTVLKGIDKLKNDNLSFDIIFIDPPYTINKDDIGLGEKTLLKLDESSIVHSNSLIFLEEGRFFNLERTLNNLKNLKLKSQRQAGESNLYEFILTKH